MKKILYFCIALMLVSHGMSAQGVAINTTGANPDSSALLDVASSTKGVLVPRMTTTQRNAITSPAQGLTIYNTETNCFNYYDGSLWLSTCGSPAVSGVPIIRVYTADAVWTKPFGLKYAIAEVVGAGGGGGGALIPSSTSGGGGGGGGGGYTKKIISASLLNSTETITVGIGGLGADVGEDGMSGGSSSFGSHCMATGGLYGEGTNPGGIPGCGGMGGIGIGGDINCKGQGGGAGGFGSKHSGGGGSSILGGGARGLSSDVASITGDTGGQYGGGGSGGYDKEAGASMSGGSGANGVVIVIEYY